MLAVNGRVEGKGGPVEIPATDRLELLEDSLPGGRAHQLLCKWERDLHLPSKPDPEFLQLEALVSF